MKKIIVLLWENAGTRSSSVLQNTLVGRSDMDVLLTHSEEGVAEVLAKVKVDAVMFHLEEYNAIINLIEKITVMPLPPVIIVMADSPSVQEAVRLARAGVTQYVEPPFSREAILAVLHTVAAAVTKQEKNGEIGKRKRADGFAGIVGESEKMQELYTLIRKVCDTDTTVLVQGESGTGKELIARALHFEGGRGSGPFVPVNCGAIPAELLESELFGHEKGAFTHAIQTRIGRFELAHGGTVFLDEISEMSPMLQVKLLRVLQERQFERVGGTRTISSDFRVIAATNRNLEEEVALGRFRQDLFYRLNVIQINAPPLREKVSDIDILVDKFIGKFNRYKKKAIRGATPEVIARMKNYPWPGNVRELENMVERMVILTLGEVLTLDDLPERLLAAEDSPVVHRDEIPPEGLFLQDVVLEYEKRLILQALHKTKWVKNRAAILLNVNRTTLIEKMKRHGIERSAEEAVKEDAIPQP